MRGNDDVSGRPDSADAPGVGDLLRPSLLALPSRGLLGTRDELRDVVLVLDDGAIERASAFARELPHVRVHLLPADDVALDPSHAPDNLSVTRCTTIAQRVDYLMGMARPQLIVENLNDQRRQKVGCFRHMFLFLDDGGTYVVEETSADSVPELEDGADAELLECIDGLRIDGNVVHVTKRHRHRVKLRDHAANAVLDRRFEGRWGRVVTTSPAYSYRNRSELFGYGDEGRVAHRPEIRVPDRYLREYRDVVCRPRQRVILDDNYLPDTFRHPKQSRLHNRALVNSSPELARDKLPPSLAREVSGDYFYFDTEYPGHFGHVLTEVVGRYRGWLEALDDTPGLRPLISLDRGQGSIPGFQRDIFTALDIPVDRIEYIHPGEALTVERLFASTSGFAMPHFADEGLAGVWGQIADRLAIDDLPTPRRIFASRRPRNTRTCRNTAEVEEFLQGLGFTVVYPEDHTFAEQVTMFRRADVIGGFGGSNMFCTMFAVDTPRFVLSGTSYTANNEQLIAAVTGGDIHYVWGDSEIHHPKGRWTWPAFQSNFSIDLHRVGDDLRRVADLA